MTRIPCVCKRGIIDEEGYHLTAQCPVGNQRFRTHDAIAVTWVAVMKQAGFLCRIEDPSCFRELDDTNKRADIVIDNWLDGKKGIFDVSVTHPWIQSADRAVPVAELAATLREQEKMRKYQQHCPARTDFIPLVVETYGRWGPMARDVFEVCMTKIAAMKGMPKSAVVAYWRQRFSMVLQKYTAACVRERMQGAVVRESATLGDESGRVDYRLLSFCR